MSWNVPLFAKTDPSDVEENDDESEIIIEKSQEKIALEHKLTKC